MRVLNFLIISTIITGFSCSNKSEKKKNVDQDKKEPVVVNPSIKKHSTKEPKSLTTENRIFGKIDIKTIMGINFINKKVEEALNLPSTGGFIGFLSKCDINAMKDIDSIEFVLPRLKGEKKGTIKLSGSFDVTKTSLCLKKLINSSQVPANSPFIQTSSIVDSSGKNIIIKNGGLNLPDRKKLETDYGFIENLNDFQLVIAIMNPTFKLPVKPTSLIFATKTLGNGLHLKVNSVFNNPAGAAIALKIVETSMTRASSSGKIGEILKLIKMKSQGNIFAASADLSWSQLGILVSMFKLKVGNMKARGQRK